MPCGIFPPSSKLCNYATPIHRPKTKTDFQTFLFSNIVTLFSSCIDFTVTPFSYLNPTRMLLLLLLLFVKVLHPTKKTHSFQFQFHQSKNPKAITFPQISSIPRYPETPNSTNSIFPQIAAMIFWKSFLLFHLTTLAFASNEAFNSHLLPRPLIIEYPENSLANFKEVNEELSLHCASWRVNVEANNVNPWKTIPEECAEYVRDYMTGRAYGVDLERASSEAGVYAKSVALNGDSKDVWIFDIDDTLLSNLPYYAQHGYGLEVFDQVEFDKWVEKGMAPAIKPSLKLYEEVLGLGFKIFLLTGRSEGKREVTIENLKNAGFQDWDKLILRATDDHGKLATIFKSEKRNEMEKQGYRILGNSGDQWSDLLGYSMSNRSFKLPNPMYHIQ